MKRSTQTHTALIASHELLVEEFGKLQRAPFDPAAHEAYRQKLTTHLAALREHLEALREHTQRGAS